MLKSEEKCASRLLEQLSIFELNQQKSGLINDYIAKLDNTIAIAHAADHDKSLSKEEIAVIHTLCQQMTDEIKGVLHHLSSNKPIDEEQFERNTKSHIRSAELRSQTIPISSGFKGLINFLCDVFVNGGIKPRINGAGFARYQGPIHG